MKRVLVITGSRMLFQKIRLELDGLCECEMNGEPKEGYDTVLTDVDSVGTSSVGLTLGSGEGCDITLPFAIGELKSRLFGKGSTALSYDRHTRRATLGGVTAALTEVEGALLEAILEGEGGFVSRESLLTRVWGEGANGGVLSVYVHYLREKLEKGGIKVILSSREMGYKINNEVLKNAENS